MEYISEHFKDPRIELYPMKKNSGISLATNYGITKVKGDYLAIIDSDDIWDEHKLERQLDYLNTHPQHKACFTWTHLIDGNGNDIDDKQPEILNLFQAYTDTREEWLHYFSRTVTG